MMAAGAQVLRFAGLSHWGNFQAKGAANRGKPLSAPAVSGAAAPLRNRRRLNQYHGIDRSRRNSIEQHPEQPVRAEEPGATWTLSLQDA
jgi:hypothetical protein